MLINAGAWTHYSYGLRDALSILTMPIIEVRVHHETRKQTSTTLPSPALNAIPAPRRPGAPARSDPSSPVPSGSVGLGPYP